MKVAAQQTIPDKVMSALANASRRTGIGFDYLMKTAARESAFNPSAKAPTSSATGLFQFIESTWLGVLRENGARFGLDEEASAIEPAGRGRFRVADPDMRSHILSLRKDPGVAALMAGAFTEDNAEYLRKAIGRDPTGGELYIAHFLGAGGAARMIELAETQPSEKAADHFPAAARANRSIFYKRGAARSVSDVYDRLVAKHEHTSTPAMAALPGASSPRLIEAPRSGRSLFSTDVAGGAGATELFRPASHTGLGPSAQRGMGTLALFTDAGAVSPVPRPVGMRVAAGTEIDGVQQAARPRSPQRFSLRHVADPSAIDTGRVSLRSGRTEDAATTGRAASVTSAQAPAQRGLGALFSGLASLFGFARGA